MTTKFNFLGEIKWECCSCKKTMNVSKFGINYCPFCGRKIADWLENPFIEYDSDNRSHGE